MKNGRPFTFDIREMLERRAAGISYSELGRIYGKDHTTIMYHCKRYGVYPAKRVRATLLPPPPEADLDDVLPAPKPLKEYKYAHLLEEEEVNPGKSYKEYLQEALKRPVEKRYYEIYYTKFHFSTPAARAPHPQAGGGRDPEDFGLVPGQLPWFLRDRDKGDQGPVSA